MKTKDFSKTEAVGIDEQERKEIAWWKNSESEGSHTFTLENITSKINAIKSFLKAVEPHDRLFRGANAILELGGGQGWASCALKKKYQTEKMITSDITHYATDSVKYWENVFAVNIESVVCKSYEIPFDDECFDMVFCYSAAHHFREYEKSLRDIFRVLKPGGYCMFFAEPSCKKGMYQLAYKRAAAQSSLLSEDVLIFPEMLNLAKRTGFTERKIAFSPKIAGRNIVEILYHFMLGKMTFLPRVFGIPCDADYVFKK